MNASIELNNRRNKIGGASEEVLPVDRRPHLEQLLHQLHLIYRCKPNSDVRILKFGYQDVNLHLNTLRP